MSDAPAQQTDVDPETLETAIAENPEAVAAFVDRLDAVNELLDVLALGTEALDDEMVVSLARTGASLGEVADVAAADDMASGLRTVLGAVGDATHESTIEPLGPLGLLRSLWDGDVRVGLGYLVGIAKNLGRRLRP
jgi:uncharacterized protein YjgD (DUF1641 family)